MVDRRSNMANAFETTLTQAVSGTDLTFNVESTSGGPASPGYLVVDPDNPSKREYVYFDGTFTATAFTTTTLDNRHLEFSAAGSGLTHDAGAVVRSASMSQMFDDLHDRADTHFLTVDHTTAAHDALAIDHGSLAGLADDDHIQYTRADGTRPFTGDISFGGFKATLLGAPVAADDAARKQEVDDHAALTAAHSATSLATANRIVRRDSAGRAEFADPSIASQVATKGYVDTWLPIYKAETNTSISAITGTFKDFVIVNIAVPATWASWHASMMFTGEANPSSPAANRNMVSRLLHGATTIGREVTGVVFAGNPTHRVHTAGSVGTRTGTGTQTFKAQARLTTDDSYNMENKNLVVVLYRVT